MNVIFDAGIRGAALILVAGIALAAWKPRAAVQLRVWSVVLAVAFLLPLATRAFVRIDLSLPIVLPATSLPIASSPAVPTLVSQGSPASTASVQPLSEVLEDQPHQVSGAAVVGLVYAAGLVLMLWRFVIALRAGSRLRARSVPVRDVNDVARCRATALAMGGRLPALAVSDHLGTPVTVGVIRPAVLLPAGWSSWPEDTLTAVLAHEMSHVRRRDALRRRVAMLYRAITWSSPLSWWLTKRLDDLAERASDEAVLESGTPPIVYAEILLQFYRSTTRIPDGLPAMASGTPAERRIHHILGFSGGTNMKSNRAVVSLVVVMLAAFVAAAIKPTQAALQNRPGQPVPVVDQTSTPVPVDVSSHVAGRRLVALVVDPRALGFDRASTLELARSFGASEGTSFSEYAVAVLDQRPSSPLVFTSNGATVFDAVAALDPQSAPLDRDLAAERLKNMCMDMSARQQRTLRQFDDGGLPMSAVIENLWVLVVSQSENDKSVPELERASDACGGVHVAFVLSLVVKGGGLRGTSSGEAGLRRVSDSEVRAVADILKIDISGDAARSDLRRILAIPRIPSIR